MKVGTMVYVDGLVAGVIGAAIIAIWFLFLDAVVRLPLYTPTVLGAGLSLGTKDLGAIEGAQVSLKLTLIYTLVHGLVFIALGEIAAFCLLLAAKKPKLRFGILLLFVILEVGFVGTALIFAEPILHELAWPAVLVGNFLAAAGMVVYLWLRHPNFELRA